MFNLGKYLDLYLNGINTLLEEATKDSRPGSCWFNTCDSSICEIESEGQEFKESLNYMKFKVSWATGEPISKNKT